MGVIRLSNSSTLRRSKEENFCLLAFLLLWPDCVALNHLENKLPIEYALKMMIPSCKSLSTKGTKRFLLYGNKNNKDKNDKNY